MFIGLIWPRDEEHVLARDVLFHCTARKSAPTARKDALSLRAKLASIDPGVGAYLIELAGERVKELWLLEDAAENEASWKDGRTIRLRVPASELHAWRSTGAVITWEADGKHATLDWPCTDAKLAARITTALNGRRRPNRSGDEVDPRVLKLLDKLRGTKSRFEAAQDVKKELKKITPPADVLEAREDQAKEREATKDRALKLTRELAANGGAAAAGARLDALENERKQTKASTAERVRIDRELRTVRAAKKKLEELELLATQPAAPLGREKSATWYHGREAHYMAGKTTKIVVPHGTGAPKEYEARYALIAAKDLGTSHDPWTFSDRPGYDQALQERDYRTSEHEQSKVIFGGTWFNPRFVLNNTPSAIDGPPIVASDGTVLGGNGRGMMLLRAMKEKTVYRDLLRVELTLAPKVYGLSRPEEDDRVLVRMLTGNYDRKAISAELNAAFTQSLGDHAKAVSLGGRLPAEVLEIIADELEDRTLAETLRARSSEIVGALRKSNVITPAELAKWTTQRGGKISDTLSEDGAKTLRNALVGALVEDRDTLTYMTSAHLEDLIERIAPVILSLEQLEASLKQEYSVLAPLRQAISDVSTVVTLSPAEFADHFANVDMFASTQDDPEVFAWIYWLWKSAKGSRVAASRTVMQAYRSLPKDGAPLLIGLEEPLKRPEWLERLGLGRIDEIRRDPRAWLVRMARAELKNTRS